MTLLLVRSFFWLLILLVGIEFVTSTHPLSGCEMWSLQDQRNLLVCLI